MDVHKKFNFDNPEDSYWNETICASPSILNFKHDFVSSVSTNLLFDNSSSFFDDNDRLTESLTDIEHVVINGLDLAESNCLHEKDKESEKRRTPKKRVVNSSSSIVSDSSFGSYSYASDLTIHLDYGRLKSEHLKLQKHFEKFCGNRNKPLPVSDTVRRLAEGNSVSLDLYKSKKKKIEILDSAVESLDWDSIITVILFLKCTLSNCLFRQILLSRTIAAECYVSYLKEMKNFVELIDTLISLGRNDEAAMVEFRLACRKKQVPLRIEALRACLLGGFNNPPFSVETKYLMEYIEILEINSK